MIDFTLDRGSDGAEPRLSGDLTIESARKARVIVLEAMEDGADCAGRRVLLAAGIPCELRKAAAGAGFALPEGHLATGANQGPCQGGRADG